jgi:Domain of unknown function (DUF5666)
MEDFSMRFRTALSLATFFLACLAIAVWTNPITAQAAALDAAPDTQSVAGKISSVGDAAFTLDVAKSQNSDANTLQFLIDGSTKVEGRLSVGAHATVEYRTDNGKYIATHVVVTPASGVSY